jgi:hypothetical protein
MLNIFPLPAVDYRILTRTGAGIPQSVYRLAKGWTTQGSEFQSRYCQEFSLLHAVLTDPGAHPTSYPMGTGGSFPGGKAAGV